MNKISLTRHLDINSDPGNQFTSGKFEVYNDILDYIEKLEEE
jgi:hypothetical protein